MKPLYDFTNLAVDRTLAPQDGMVAAGLEEQYFDLGRRALELIHFSSVLCDKPHYPRILDLPCGHGRVLRWLRSHYHYAEITACDLDRDGVDFCAQHFRANPVYSRPHLSELPFNDQFDLIWVGSLFTHLDEARWKETLDCLVRWTRECGVIVFTVQSRTVASLLQRGQKNIAEDIDKAALLAEFPRRGFAYQRYFGATPEADYGLTLNSSSWLMAQLQRHPDIIIRAYLEEVWGLQDVVILYKKTGHYEPIFPAAGASVPVPIPNQVTATAATASSGFLRRLFKR